ncbi:MAG: DUF3368 domain-containing protein [Symploca sp. SIO2E6]|nr:DUF3368 domain-containing protein [Symploca sp. SIO2E6]
MTRAISNTSPMLYLHRIGKLDWLPEIFAEILVPSAVVNELREGRPRGYDCPDLSIYTWLQVVEPISIPANLTVGDLGLGEQTAIALTLENSGFVVLLDDGLARSTAQALGLTVWGTLKILLTAKSQGLTEQIMPLVDQLQDSGMWISDDIRSRVIHLAGESNH